MLSLLYISHSLLDATDADQIVQDIVTASIARNQAVGITGALVFTGVNFAQFLEGPDQPVLELMNSVRRDARHKDVWVAFQASTNARRFGNWSMAYGGRSGFVSRQITDLISASKEAQREKTALKIIEMMEEFAT